MPKDNDENFEVREVYFDDEGSGPECAFVYLSYRGRAVRDSFVGEPPTDDRS